MYRIRDVADFQSVPDGLGSLFYSGRTGKSVLRVDYFPPLAGRRVLSPKAAIYVLARATRSATSIVITAPPIINRFV